MIHTEPGSKLHRLHQAAEARGQGLVLQEGDPLHAHLARQAFAKASHEPKRRASNRHVEEPARAVRNRVDAPPA